jgi:hypothetical protein
MGDAAVVAARLHAVMSAQRFMEVGLVLGGIALEIAKGRREAVAAVIPRRAAEQPQRVLQPLDEGCRHGCVE